MNNVSQSRPQTVQAVDRAIALIALLAQKPEGLSLGQIALGAGLKKQTAQSLLRTLEHHGLVLQQGRGEPYRLGPRVHEWSRSWNKQLDYVAVTAPMMTALAERIREYVLLAQLRGGTLVRMVERSTDRSLMATASAENPVHLHTMATAKVLLAWLDENQRDRILGRLKFCKRGPASVTSKTKFLSQLKQTRLQGYAECINEAAEGLAALAVPVVNAAGECILAVGAAIPLVRYETSRDSVLRALQETAQMIRQTIGQ